MSSNRNRHKNKTKSPKPTTTTASQPKISPNSLGGMVDSSVWDRVLKSINTNDKNDQHEKNDQKSVQGKRKTQ